MAEVRKPEAMIGFLRSITLHSLMLRLKQSFIHVGHGDERRVIAHAKLPIQFPGSSSDIITICESGAGGDGTTRGFIANIKEAIGHWSDGFLTGCPNAEEDRTTKKFWQMSQEHQAWRAMDPRDPSTAYKLAAALGLLKGVAPPASILRLLYDAEAVGPERIELYGLAVEIEALRRDLETRLGRYAQDWELTSLAVQQAKQGQARELARLLTAFVGLEDIADSEAEALSAESRLSDQVYRIGGRLCADGCRGCVHQSSDLMSDSLVEVTVSRKVLQSFLSLEFTGAGQY
jgi:hypothetical protein